MRKHSTALGSVVSAILVVSLGCASPLPGYEWQDTQTAIGTMNRRDGAIRTFSAACRILLESDGGRVELTAVLVAQPPHRLRLRAWKFSQAVFDITLNNDGLFVFDNLHSRDANEKLRRINHTRFVEALAFLPGFERQENWQTGAGRDDDEFMITKPSPDQGSAIECIIDKNTLVRQRCVYRDSDGNIRQRLHFEAHKLIGDSVWPMRVRGSGESGSFVLLFDRIDINVGLSARAFDPPRRAVKLP